jgi:LPXTG-site transpeptidase (sortase) family protein
VVIDPAVAKSGDPSVASVGEVVTFTLVVSNNGNASAANVEVTDTLPSFLDITGVVVAPPGPGVTVVGNTITIDFGTVAPNDVYTVTITTLVNSLATPPGGTNIATLTTTSPDADPDNNQDSAELTIVVPGAPQAPGTGFSPGRITYLPLPLPDPPYISYGDLRLEIPSMGVDIPILGVPRTDTGWDVTWLWDEAGYLNGTAFPTWSGNSVITAHVSLPDGNEGPFAGLDRLRYGEQVILHGWDLRYIYEIREVDRIPADDPSIFRHEDRSWVTLVTCYGYDEEAGSYRLRVAAHAVLVAIEQDDAPSARPFPAEPGQISSEHRPKAKIDS